MEYTRTLQRWGAALVLAAGLSACATHPHQTIATLKQPDIGTGEHLILLLPVEIQLGELNAGGLFERRADWTELGRTHMRNALQQELSKIRGRLVRTRDVDQDEKQIQIMKLNDAVGRSIHMHQYAGPLQLPTKREDFRWTLGADVRYLKQKYNTDYAFFVSMRDSYSTTGRVAVIAVAALFGVAVHGGQQSGFASLVDLETGDVVWFNRLVRGTGDLRTANAAQESAKILLNSFPK